MWALAAALAVLSVMLIAPPPSIVRAEGTAARVSITGLTPFVLKPRGALQLSGRVANAATYDLTELSVRLTISSAPLPSREAIDAVASGMNSFDGFAIAATTTAVAATLQPGRQRDFRIRVQVEDLPLPAPGVYVLGVQVVGVDPTLGYTVLSSDRVLLPWVPEEVESPLNLVWMWPLAADPGRTPDGVLLGRSTPRDIDTRGRLLRLLEAGATAPKFVSWVVDPSLTQTVQQMTDGYLVDVAGEVQPGTRERAATAWLTRFQEVVARQSLWGLPYADVDADALLRGGLERDVVRAIGISPTVIAKSAQVATAGTLYWSPGGRIDASTLTLLASTGIRAVVVRDQALPPLFDPGYTPSGSVDLDTQFGPMRAIVLDAGLMSSLSMPQGNSSEVLAARQRFMAETAFIALEPSASTSRVVVAAGRSTRWSANPRLLRELLTTLRLSPWVSPMTLDTMLLSSPSVVARTQDSYGPAQRSRELPESYVQRIVVEQRNLGLLRSVVNNSVDLAEPISEALLRSSSSAWRTDVDRGEQLLDSISVDLSTDIAKVAVVSRGTVTFSGNSGRVPITIANDFDRPVTVGLRLAGQPEARLVSEPLENVEIGPGRRASLEVSVRIVGGEPVPVTVHVVTPDGIDFGATTTLELQTTAYSRAALWVSIGAAVLLFLLVIFDTYRRARQRRAVHASDKAKASGRGGTGEDHVHG